MVKTKIILSSHTANIESKMNNFLSNEDVNLIDIKIAVGIGKVVCCIIYRKRDK